MEVVIYVAIVRRIDWLSIEEAIFFSFRVEELECCGVGWIGRFVFGLNVLVQFNCTILFLIWYIVWKENIV